MDRPEIEQTLPFVGEFSCTLLGSWAAPRNALRRRARVGKVLTFARFFMRKAMRLKLAV